MANHLISQGDNVLTAELVHPEELMSGLLSQVVQPRHSHHILLLHVRMLRSIPCPMCASLATS